MNKLALTLLTSFSLAAAALAGPGFTINDQTGEHLDVLRDGKLVARYMYAHDTATGQRRGETYKPYLHVFDADGKAPITKGPGGTFTHHRGIFIGWNKLSVAGKQYDRWHMKAGDQVHQRFLAEHADPERASFTSRVAWTADGTDAPLLEEERTFTFLPSPAPAYALIETASKLKAVGGETVLAGDPEHAGLQFRPAEEVDRAQTVYLFPKENANPNKDRDYPWVAETFTLAGKRYSVVYLNHPANPKDTPFSAYRNYGRFGGFFKATIPAGGELTLRARFVIAEGEMPSPDWIQKQANAFTGASDPTPLTTLKLSAPDKPAAPKAPAPAR